MPTDQLVDWGLGGSLWDDGGPAFAPTGDETITATLRKRHTVNGVLTSYTSLVLSDPATPSTFGLRKVSDGTVIVPHSTPYVETSTGVYEYTTPALERGEQYEYWEYWSYGGETDRRQVFFTAPLAATHISSVALMRQLAGTLNETAYADPDGAGNSSEITSREEWALTEVDTLADKELYKVGKVRADVRAISVLWERLVSAGTRVGVAYIYGVPRGQEDLINGFGKMQPVYDQGVAEIQEIAQLLVEAGYLSSLLAETPASAGLNSGTNLCGCGPLGAFAWPWRNFW